MLIQVIHSRGSLIGACNPPHTAEGLIVALPVAAGTARGNLPSNRCAPQGRSTVHNATGLLYEAGLSEVIIFLMFLYSWVPM